MMRKLLFAFLLISIVKFSNAQTINFGVKAGLNLSELTHSDPNGYGSSILAGFRVGGIVDIGFQNFSIQPGVFYSTKGEKDKMEFVGSDGLNTKYLSSKIVLNYIEIPVNFLYKWKVAPGIKFDLGGGPYIGYGTSETVTYPDFNSATRSAHGKFTYKNPDFGVNLVAGVEIKNKFIIDAGYGYGLSNIASYNSTIHNSVFSISLGYMFR
ncbi:PorT family protein [Mucilaginibacter sp. BJC16-A38]|uniref:porin family protein n=1 Tax=Mucilaginibacter phenanthrenivorans TaxID=1234842 RepID=UPI0021585967|nr:porin family protein [Mucilaginibacter phenanthrenivorans]MCR8559229.1 PorT family protein [Mucilaginibacter phenanthrenivorans]